MTITVQQAREAAKRWRSSTDNSLWDTLAMANFIIDHFPEDGEENFSLWSFLRNVLSTGCAIESDSRSIPRSYEEHSARLDVAAIEFEEKLTKALGIKKRGG